MTVSTESPSGLRFASDGRSASRWVLKRGELFALAFLVAFVNAIYGIAAEEIVVKGIGSALANTFGISAILWAALYFAVTLALGDSRHDVRPFEAAAALATVAVSALPIPQFASLALFAFSGLLIMTGERGTPITRAAWIMAAATIPIFWGRRLMAYFNDAFLSFDALLVSNILGTDRNGNLVGIPGQSGYLQILEECSSFANISLSVLCWTVFTQVNQRRWRPSNILWVMAAAGAVVFINTLRMTLIGAYPESYDLLHGPVGQTVANYLIIVAVVAICAIGARRHAR
ncbi:hypothetical protein [Chthonobacter albigriseus]|uniref:hypothetical protein n=1 Tax=Chthonobacter albigriseus TaxID=1683161 RepID=UPI0015EFBC59|nr:hypothetical protein [Chthonobacter albigriseus]